MHDAGGAARAAPSVIVPCNFTINDQTAAAQRPDAVTVDVTFPSATKVARIAFRNSYAASVSVRFTTDRAALMRSDRENLDGWRLMVENYTLMVHPLVETESQLWHSITSKHFVSGSGDTPAIALRLYLRQPAVHWRAITLKQIQVHTYSSAAPLPTIAGGKEAALQAQLAKSKGVSSQIEALSGVGVELFSACQAFGAWEIPTRRRVVATSEGGAGAGDGV
mmetsp:Transcript_36385/g.86113  ORF Transcript_36385/g.86113 Transcript_36385/m.86113 type:complete len:222 (+) Transcript_36385:116-781(+)